MNYKKNYRFDCEARWIKNLTYTVYKKPRRFYMNDNYKYDNVIKSGTLLVNENNVFIGETVDQDVITRYSFSISSLTKKYISLIITSNIRAKIWCNQRLIDMGKVCKSCPIYTDDIGYRYKDIVFEGAYCCMQILPNPWNSSKHILYITYNDENIIQRNLFLRRMVLPSYIKGRHVYLNETALIFDGNNYWVLNTAKGELEKV